jgi:hypothetical protein
MSGADRLDASIEPLRSVLALPRTEVEAVARLSQAFRSALEGIAAVVTFGSQTPPARELSTSL